jgi:predicted metal-dependent phosphoesterase TrpH
MPWLRSRDCYSRPQDVYRVAKARGMDLVAITDHDSIDGALELLDRRPGAPDIIVGEEVSCRLPDGDLEVHLGVYGMTEALHADVQRLRRNVFDVTARLREARVFFALNHLLHFYHSRTPLDVYLRLLDEVPALEVRNGAMLAAHNRLVDELAVRWRPACAAQLAVVAGSDAHTLRRVGTTWTEAPGRDRDEFLRSVRDGRGRPGGRDGTPFTVAADAYGVIVRYVSSLAGLGPRDHRALHRAACLAFTAASLPFQFVPLLVALAGKSRERKTVRLVGGQMTGACERMQGFDADDVELAENSQERVARCRADLRSAASGRPAGLH